MESENLFFYSFFKLSSECVAVILSAGRLRFRDLTEDIVVIEIHDYIIERC